MRKIDYIIIHCSATKEGQDIKFSDIEKWHKSRGFNKIGYHYIIALDGSLYLGRNIKEVGAHCKGYNKNSIGICYIGGLDKAGNPKDTRNSFQKQTLLELLKMLSGVFPLAKIVGHNNLAAKACPCFDVIKEYRNLL